MRRQRDEMQVNVAGLRRNIKNLAHNYSDAQIKVREATSNDPWGPSSTIMSEIADLTYNVVAYTEIMQMIWKRLNDHGKNWRHVYKALVLLEYLIKTGSEKVAQQCKENIFAVQTLKDFQYAEEGKDKGINVREKAKQLVTLLRDEERLRNERARALKAKERFAQSACAFGSDGALSSGGGADGGSPTGHRDAFRSSEWSSPSPPPNHRHHSSSASSAAAGGREMESARPQTAGEEELQLQLALAMSREEAEQEEQRRRSDDVRLQLALSESQHDFRPGAVGAAADNNGSGSRPMVDLLDVSLSDLASGGTSPPLPPPPPPHHHGGGASSDPWGLPPPSTGVSNGAAARGGQQPQSSSDPWNANPTSPVLPPGGNRGGGDPWSSSSAATGGAEADPWAPLNSNTTSPIGFMTSERPSPLGGNNLRSPGSSSDLSEFDIITNRNKQQQLQQQQLDNNGIGITSNGKSPSNNNNNHSSGGDPFDLGHLDDLLGVSTTPNHSSVSAVNKGCIKKTPQSFLGENSALVNLDNLIKSHQQQSNNHLMMMGSNSSASAAANNHHQHQQNVSPVPMMMGAGAYGNPFQDGAGGLVQPQQQQQQVKNNLFLQQQMQQVRPSMNQIKQAPLFSLDNNLVENNTALFSSTSTTTTTSRDPWAPVADNNTTTTNNGSSPWAPIVAAPPPASNNKSSPWTIQQQQNNAWVKQDHKQQQSVNPFLS